MNLTGSQTGLVQEMKKNASYSFEERIHAIRMYEQGQASKRISEALGIDPSTIRRWWRRFRLYGEESLLPYWREKHRKDFQAMNRAEVENRFAKAYETYATSPEPITSIARRFSLDYHSFKYHVERYHPEYVERRRKLLAECENNQQS